MSNIANKSQVLQRRAFPSAAPAAVALAAAVMLLSLPAAHAQPVTSSSLYYRLGGGAPIGQPPHRGALSLQLNSGLRANYSCGKFDVGASWANLMGQIQNLGATITGAVQAGIAALPLYIFQRAQPGLYQLFQNFSQKADLLVSASLKTCEEMEAQIKAGKDPYEEYVALAKGDAWKVRASASGDVVQAKYDINKDEVAQRAGINWVYGQKAGGSGTAPIQPIRDLAIAGYNVTINKSASTLSTANYGSSSLASTRLVQAFETPENLAKWTTEVLGDQRIHLCTQGPGCPEPTSTVTATGLAPKFEQELDVVLPAMRVLAESSNSKMSNMTELAKVSAPGMVVSPQLMEAVRKLPTDIRSVAVNRLSQEISMHRVIDKALIARNALISGMSLPQVTAATPVSSEAQIKVDRLTQYINDMMFEFRIRKEITGDTAVAIMNSDISQSRKSTLSGSGIKHDPFPAVDGRVENNK